MQNKINKKSKIAVLGFGVEGRSLLNFLKHNHLYKNSEIWVLDSNKSIIVPRGVKKNLGKTHLKNLDQFNIIFRSPSISPLLPEIKSAIKNGIKVTSATNLFFELFGGKIIGITGTKGKGTTSTMLYEIMKRADLSVYLAGNIGTPMLDLLSKTDKKSWVILELSSFQLWDLKQSPTIAALVDVFTDHLDNHKSLDDYYSAKLNIVRFQKKNDMVFFFSDNFLRNKIVHLAESKKHEINLSQFKLLRSSDLKMIGRHNFKNAAMAASIAQNLGIDKKTILQALKNFHGLEHRLEFVRSLNGIDFYNDSASTNPMALIAAVNAVSEKYENIILIAGGINKNLSLVPLKQLNKNRKIKKVFLIGKSAKDIQKIIFKKDTVIIRNLDTAVKSAYTFFKKTLLRPV